MGRTNGGRKDCFEKARVVNGWTKKATQVSIVQCLTNLREPVAMPAVHLVAPGLTRWIKADPSRMWVMGITLLAWGTRTCPRFSRRRKVGMTTTAAFATLTLCRRLLT